MGAAAGDLGGGREEGAEGHVTGTGGHSFLCIGQLVVAGGTDDGLGTEQRASAGNVTVGAAQMHAGRAHGLGQRRVVVDDRSARCAPVHPAPIRGLRHPVAACTEHVGAYRCFQRREPVHNHRSVRTGDRRCCLRRPHRPASVMSLRVLSAWPARGSSSPRQAVLSGVRSHHAPACPAAVRRSCWPSCRPCRCCMGRRRPGGPGDRSA